jgi:hypothetical protein
MSTTLGTYLLCAWAITGTVVLVTIGIAFTVGLIVGIKRKLS